MTLKLPPHVEGWTIPATKDYLELSVTRGGWIGLRYDAGRINPDVTKGFTSTAASAWFVEGDSRRGLAIMNLSTQGPYLDERRRATAALLHLCIEAEGPNGSGFLPEGGVLYVPRFKTETVSREDAELLQQLGFSAQYQGGELVGQPDHIRGLTEYRFPEFADAVEIPQMTQEEWAAAGAALAAKSADTQAE